MQQRRLRLRRELRRRHGRDADRDSEPGFRVCRLVGRLLGHRQLPGHDEPGTVGHCDVRLDHGAGYAWSFGDGTPAGSGQIPSHTYAKAGSYTVTLTVTDDAGETAVTSEAFNPISVSARGYKLKGADRVNLSWHGASDTSFDVYRNGTNIGSLRAFSYTDTVTGTGTFSYKVCASATSICSNPATVSF